MPEAKLKPYKRECLQRARLAPTRYAIINSLKSFCDMPKSKKKIDQKVKFAWGILTFASISLWGITALAVAYPENPILSQYFPICIGAYTGVLALLIKRYLDL